MSIPYAVACKSCGHVEQFAWALKDGKAELGMVRTTTPLTPRGQAPVYCQKCGNRSWQVPATADQIAKYEAKIAREARATELCRTLNLDGLFKIPEEIKGSAEIKNALSNLFAPLEGETLKTAQAHAIRVARSGVAAEADVWVGMYDQAVQKAVKGAKAA